MNEEVNSKQEPALAFDGLDEAIVGIALRACQSPLLCYDEEKIVEIFQKHGMTYEEAAEYASFNVFSLWAGEGTPVILSRMTAQEAHDALSEFG